MSKETPIHFVPSVRVSAVVASLIWYCGVCCLVLAKPLSSKKRKKIWAAHCCCDTNMHRAYSSPYNLNGFIYSGCIYELWFKKLQQSSQQAVTTKSIISFLLFCMEGRTCNANAANNFMQQLASFRLSGKPSENWPIAFLRHVVFCNHFQQKKVTVSVKTHFKEVLVQICAFFYYFSIILWTAAIEISGGQFLT